MNANYTKMGPRAKSVKIISCKKRKEKKRAAADAGRARAHAHTQISDPTAEDE